MTELDELAGVARRKTKQVAKAKMDLEVTPSLRIGVSIYIKSKIVSLPTLKKRDMKHNCPVRLDRTYVRVDDPDTAVEDIITALRYGAEYVPITEADMDSLKLMNQSKCLKVIGFFDKEIFAVHRLISNADCIAAEPGKPHAAVALSSLIHALAEEGKVALCRFSVRDHSEPKIVCLFPHIEEKFECFYSVQVPFAEDSRENSLLFPSLPQPGAELLADIDQLIDARMLGEDDACLVPEKTINPTLYRFWKTIEGRAERKDDTFIAPIDAIIEQIVYPEKNLSDIEKIVEKIKKYLTEVRGDSPETKRKNKFWREHNGDLIQSPRKNIDVKRIRIEGEGDARAEAPSIIDHLRSASQISTQVDTQGEVSASTLESIKVILVDIEANRPSQAAQKIKNLRETCVLNESCGVFNEFIQSLVAQAEQHPQMWRELIGAGVSLITQDEVKSAKPCLSDAHLLLEKVMKMV